MAFTTGAGDTTVFTTGEPATLFAGAKVVTGPGAAVAVNVSVGTPSALAVSVCNPAVVPRRQPPEEAVPSEVVRTESFVTTPPPLAFHRTITPLTPLPPLSVMRTEGTVAGDVATVALSDVAPTAKFCVGTGSLLQPATSSIAALAPAMVHNRVPRAIMDMNEGSGFLYHP
jgi:hypothetical protein